MNNTSLIMLLPFLMGGRTGNMTALLQEVLKADQKAIDPMTFLLLGMMTGKGARSGEEQKGTDAVKDFGGDDVTNVLKILLRNKDQSV